MSRDYYFQEGGGQHYPTTWFNPNATPFQPCAACGKPKRSAGKQDGGGINMPYRYFNPNAAPFQPCAACGKAKRPGKVRANSPPLAVYANDFMRSQGCHDYNSCNMTSGSCQGCGKGGRCKGGRCKGGCGPRCGCVRAQKGGNPTGAPLQVFSEGQKQLSYNFNLQDTFSGLPVFDSCQ